MLHLCQPLGMSSLLTLIGADNQYRLRHLLRCWTPPRWSLHRTSELEVVFLDQPSFRWCCCCRYVPFSFNLQVTDEVAVIFLLPARDPAKREGGHTGWRQVKQMDYIGSALILACITCLLLALQWGGNDYAWSSECSLYLILRIC